MEDVQLTFWEFILNHPILIAVFLIALYFTIVNTIKMKLSKVKIVTPNELAISVNHFDTIVLDIRSSDEFKIGHISQAINVIESDIQKDNLGSISKDKSKPVIIVDKDGTRTYELGAMLLNIGFKDVSALRGGIFNWQQAGMPLVKK